MTGQFEVVKYLISTNPDVLNTEDGKMYLFDAVCYKQIHVVKLLLHAFEVDVNHVTYHGQVHCCRYEICKI